MNTPQPNPQPVGSAKKPLVVPRISRRDLIWAVAIVLAILGFIWLAVRSLDTKPKNTLSGIVRSHSSTGERETLLDVSRKGVQGQAVDTGYYLEVYVSADQRVYKVTVEKELWNRLKDGDRLDFLRPVAEQQY